MNQSRPRVLVIGAAGVFGSRLVQQLVETTACDLVLAGRNPDRLALLIAKLNARGFAVSAVRFDRTQPDADTLRTLALAIVIDAAGPFQQASLALPEVCIAANVHYLDLADARDFVARVNMLDTAAKAAGVAVISGASSTPALSHAVIDELTAGWRRRDQILVAISPGNRVPRGLALVEAILSNVGQPVKVFREGGWQVAAGWTLDESVEIAGMGKRNVVLCETPDLDLLVDRYSPQISAELKAGLELGLMHHGLRALTCLVRLGWVRSLRPLTRPLHAIASLLRYWGSDIGGMLVQVTGRDQTGQARRIRWSLVAKAGRGPLVPVLPAVCMVQSLLDGSVSFRGAAPAAGFLRLDAITHHLDRLGITTTIENVPLLGPYLFEHALGARWHVIPVGTRIVHSPSPSLVLEGRANIEGAKTAAGRLFAKLLGFPVGASDVPLRVSISRNGDDEIWVRQYPERTMRSVLTRADPEQCNVEEHFGPLHFKLRLRASAQGIDLDPVSISFCGLRMPAFLLPRVVANERATEDGRHQFDVVISIILLGRLVHYRGWIKPCSL